MSNQVTPKSIQHTVTWKRAVMGVLSPKNTAGKRFTEHRSDASSTTPTHSDQMTPVASNGAQISPAHSLEPTSSPPTLSVPANVQGDLGDFISDADDPNDPFITAGFALIKHGSLKRQLHDLVEVNESRASSLLVELQLSRQSQDEVIKASVTKRKLIASLREQVKEERQRRDRLALLRVQQRHPAIDALRDTLAKFTSERLDLEAELNHQHGKLKQAAAEVERLRECLKEAKADASRSERFGVRAARRNVMPAEKDHRNDMERWLSLLRGETEDDRKQKAKEKKVTRLPPGTQVNATVALLQRPDLLTKVGALGTGAELEQLLSVYEVVQENNRVEKVYKLQQKRLEVAMQVLAPQLLEKQRELERQQRLEQQDREVAMSTLTMSSVFRSGDASRSSPVQQEESADSIETLPQAVLSQATV